MFDVNHTVKYFSFSNGNDKGIRIEFFVCRHSILLLKHKTIYCSSELKHWL